MPWTIDKTGAKIAAGWEPKGKNKAAQDKWNKFMDEVRKGKHPVEAAKAIGDSNFKILKGSKGQAQLRLSQSERASFIVDDKAERISKIQLGGHT